jgi:hypothetical protein
VQAHGHAGVDTTSVMFRAKLGKGLSILALFLIRYTVCITKNKVVFFGPESLLYTLRE